MKHIHYFTFIILIIAISPPAVADPSWENLFNGKDLKGWKPLNGKALFRVEHGEIIGTTVANEPNSFLVTEETYGDFILELEFKLDAEMNSGIQFRSESKPDYMNGRVHGYQVEIDPSARAWTGGIYDEARRDWLYTMEYNPSAKTCYKKNDWNLFRIECIGPVIRVWVNGIATAHVVDNLTPKGFIALQVHSIGKDEIPGKQIHWRNIRIQTKNLVPTPWDDLFVVNLVPNSLSAQEEKAGVKLLWDGKTTEGWRESGSDKFPENKWKIEGEELSVMKIPASEKNKDLVTLDEYGSFDLQFEFKLTDGANSGVKYLVKEKSDGSAIGLEYQILDDERHPDAKMGVVGNRTQASLYDLIPSTKIKRGQHPVGTWNYGRIIVFPDRRVEHWLNGYKVLEYQIGTPVYLVLVARSKYAGFENFGMDEKGKILLQDHGDQVSFRSIKIKPLKSK